MKDRLLQLLREEFPEVDFECSDALVDDGILDSLTITGVISAITMEYGISIPYEEIVEENFNSVDAMVELITRMQE